MQIKIEVSVDENGDYRVAVEDDEVVNNLDMDLAIRKVSLVVEIPEPTVQEIDNIQAPASKEVPATVKVA